MKRMSQAAVQAIHLNTNKSPGEAAASKSRSLGNTFSDIIANPSISGGKLLDFSVAQTLEQSGLSITERAAVYNELMPAIKSKDSAAVLQTMRDIGMSEKFDTHARWLGTSKGRKFIEEQVPHMRQVSAHGMVGGAVKWSGIQSNAKGISNITEMMHERLSRGMGVDSSMLSLSYSGGHKASFNIEGLGKQVSKVHEFTFQIQSEGIKFKIPLYQPSKAGFMVQSRDTVSAGFTKGESVFATPETFYTDLKYNKQTQEHTLRRANSFWEFQQIQLEQLSRRVKGIRSSSSLSAEDKQFKIKGLVKTFTQAQEKNQFFLASASVLDGSMENAGVGQFTQNLKSKGAVMTQTAGLETGLSDIKEIKDPRVVQDIMMKDGVVMNLSSGMATKDRGIMAPGFVEGVERLPHLDPRKALSELTPARTGAGDTLGGLIPRNIAVFKTETESLVTNKSKDIFNPTGFQAIATVGLPTTNRAKALGFGTSELFMPDGVIVAKESMHQSGILDAGYSASRHVKASGPGSVGPGLFGKTVSTIMDGGVLQNMEGKSFTIPGMKASRDSLGEVDFYKAVGAESPKDFEKMFPGGIPLGEEEFLGFDPGTGRRVSSEGNRTLRESITKIVRGSSDEDINILLSRHTQSYRDETGRLVTPEVKVVGSMQTKLGPAYKSQIETATSDQFRNQVEASLLTREIPMRDAMKAARGTEMLIPNAMLEDPVMKLMGASGAIKFEMEDKLGDMWKETGEAKSVQQQAQKKAIMEMASYSNEELLKNISSGKIAEQLEIVSKISDPHLQKVKEILRSKGRVSMDKKVASVAYALFGTLPEKERVAALGNVLSAHTKMGKAMSWNTFGSTDSQDVTERLFNWSGQSTAQQLKGQAAQEWRSGKTILKEMDDAFSGAVTESGSSLSKEIMDSYEPHRFVTPVLVPRDTTGVLGSGMHATLEPRFFDIALAVPELQPAFREITQRTTDFRPVMEKIKHTLKGTAPLQTPSISLSDAAGDIGKNIIGNSDTRVNLGMTKNLMAEVQTRLNQINPELGGKVAGEIFVPGGEDVRSMNMMVTGTGVEKAKPLRAVYTDYLKSVGEAHQMVGSERVDSLARATGTFQTKLQQAFKTQLIGAPKGSAQGALRAPVKGSGYLLMKAPGADFLEVMDLLPMTEGGRTANLSEPLRTFKRELTGRLQSGESMGRQQMVSKASINRMYGESIAASEKAGTSGLTTNLHKDWNTLKKGGSVVGLATRHPGIGINSATPARIYMDHFSANSATQEFVRGGDSFLNVIEKAASGSADIPNKQMWLTSIAQDLAADRDGDRMNIFITGTKEAQAGLGRLMKNEHQHAVRYNMIKEIAKRSIATDSGLSGGSKSVLDAFGESSKGLFSEAQEASFRQVSKLESSSTLAHSATGKIVPRISNTFTEIKFAVAQSDLGSKGKADLFRFFEAAEQVPISAKHLTKAADSSLEVVSQIQRMHSAMFSDAKTSKNAIHSMVDLFANEEVVRNYNVEIAGEAAEHMIRASDYAEMKTNLTSVIQEFGKREEGQNMLKLLKGSSSGVTNTGDMFKAFEHYKPNLAKVMGHSMEFAEATADISRNVLSEINSGITNAGRKVAQRGSLPTKGIMGLAMTAAAGMLVAGSASIALGPTWSDAASGGAYADPDFLFPGEMEAKNARLHGNSIPTPISGNLVTPSYEATIHLPPGAYSPGTLAGRLGTIMTSNAGSARLEMQDNRSSLDTFSLARIKNEII